MSRSTCESHRDNQVAAATFKTPDGIPFFGWTEDGQYEYVKLSIEDVQLMYDIWEGRQAGGSLVRAVP